MKRTPRNYRGAETTTHRLSDLLPQILNKMGSNFKDRPDIILATWPDIIGPRLEKMTEAVSFIEGILTVKVKNSTLYALLDQQDKPKLLKELRLRFPNVMIKSILFRIG